MKAVSCFNFFFFQVLHFLKAADCCVFIDFPQKQEYQLINLKSDCVYSVRVQSMNYRGDKDKGTLKYFSTPPCEETEGWDRSTCPSKSDYFICTI